MTDKTPALEGSAHAKESMREAFKHFDANPIVSEDLSEKLIADGWIKHDGGTLPIKADQYVELMGKNYTTGIHIFGENEGREWKQVIAYRLWSPISAALQPVSAEPVAFSVVRRSGNVSLYLNDDKGKEQAFEDAGLYGAKPEPLYISPSDQSARIRELEVEVKAERNRACNAEYMRDFCRQLLGPVASEVVEGLITDGVRRVHVSWGPEAMRLTGEQRAAQYRAFSNAPRTVVKFNDEFEALNKESKPS